MLYLCFWICLGSLLPKYLWAHLHFSSIWQCGITKPCSCVAPFNRKAKDVEMNWPASRMECKCVLILFLESENWSAIAAIWAMYHHEFPLHQFRYNCAGCGSLYWYSDLRNLRIFAPKLSFPKFCLTSCRQSVVLSWARMLQLQGEQDVYVSRRQIDVLRNENLLTAGMHTAWRNIDIK